MLTKDDLKKLAGVCGPCLTIIEPLRDEYSQVTKPATRVVAAIQEAGRLLEEKGFSAAERDEMTDETFAQRHPKRRGHALGICSEPLHRQTQRRGRTAFVDDEEPKRITVGGKAKVN